MSYNVVEEVVFCTVIDLSTSVKEVMILIGGVFAP